MPSFPYTPGALTLTGADIFAEPIRFTFTPGSLSVAGGDITVGPSLSNSLQALAAVLDELNHAEAIVDSEGRPSRRFQQIWANAIGGLKDVLENIVLSVDELERIYQGINTAQSTAATAVQTANATDAELALVNSFTDPVGVTTASSSGTITIDAHDRVYRLRGVDTPVSVNGGSVSGFSPGDYVTVYYNDPARAGGAVTYQGTTDAVSQTGSTHIVGQVPIPQVGEADVPGAGPTAPGYTPPPDDFDPRLINYGPQF